MLRKKKLPFMAVLGPEDYGAVIRCLVIHCRSEEEMARAEQYQFPGPVRERFRSDGHGYPDPRGMFYTVFPVSGPEIEWTMAFSWNERKERNEYRKLDLEGLTCVKTICPVLERFRNRKPYRNIQGEDGKEILFHYMDYLPECYRDRTAARGSLKHTLPLIIWLHGAGEGGTDPTITVLGNRVTALTEETVQTYFPETGAAVLAPQCPTMWMDLNGKGVYNVSRKDSDGKSCYSKALLAFIRRYLQYHPEIDRDRIYIGGCSNGGYMTIKMLIEAPELFAAAFPCCPAYHAAWQTPERVKTLAGIPIWFTAAATDQTVPLTEKDGSPAYADALVPKLREASGEVIYTRLPQVMGFDSKGFPYEYNGHFSWIPLLQDRITKEIDGEEIHLFEWLASKGRK